MKNFLKTKTALVASAVVLANVAMIGTASAHCDGLDGPVISEARSALERRDVTPLLKWVPQGRESTIKDAFAQTLQARAAGATARDAADMKLFETLVQVHRESEGASFTGIKPAGQIPAVVKAADAALDKKNVDRLAKHIAAQVEEAVRDKFAKAAHSEQYANQSVKQGREFVSDYVQYVHFVEQMSDLAASEGNHLVSQDRSAHAH